MLSFVAATPSVMCSPRPGARIRGAKARAHQATSRPGNKFEMANGERLMNTKRLALSTLALAAAGAAGTASAQSSVTLYGVVDAFYQYATADNDIHRLQSGGINGSRFGVRGVEDLGGGLKALFTLEAGLNVDDGTVGQNPTGGNTFW